MFAKVLKRRGVLVFPLAVRGACTTTAVSSASRNNLRSSSWTKNQR